MVSIDALASVAATSALILASIDVADRDALACPL